MFLNSWGGESLTKKWRFSKKWFQTPLRLFLCIFLFFFSFYLYYALMRSTHILFFLSRFNRSMFIYYLYFMHGDLYIPMFNNVEGPSIDHRRCDQVHKRFTMSCPGIRFIFLYYRARNLIVVSDMFRFTHTDDVRWSRSKLSPFPDNDAVARASGSEVPEHCPVPTYDSVWEQYVYGGVDRLPRRVAVPIIGSELGIAVGQQ